jgi:hypothetical protein
MLVAAVYQTPGDASEGFGKLAELVESGTLELREQAEEVWVNQFHLDLRGWGEWLLVKRVEQEKETVSQDKRIVSKLLSRNITPSDLMGGIQF